jgi:hypothetical protein
MVAEPTSNHTTVPKAIRSLSVCCAKEAVLHGGMSL